MRKLRQHCHFPVLQVFRVLQAVLTRVKPVTPRANDGVSGVTRAIDAAFRDCPENGAAQKLNVYGAVTPCNTYLECRCYSFRSMFMRL